MADRAMTPVVAWCLPDKLGGVLSYVQNLLAHRRPDGCRHEVVLTDNLRMRDARSEEPLAADRLSRIVHELPPENLYTVLRRVRDAVGVGPGVVMANDWIELAMATAYDCGKSVVQIVHGDFDFYYGLADAHEPVVDAFVTYSHRVDAAMRDRFPHRRDDIHFLRYGVAIPPAARTPGPGPLRLLYVGRMHRDKGIFLLPQIDRRLAERGVAVTWTLQGIGPDLEALRGEWSGPHLTWSGRRPAAEVHAHYLAHDVLVMPSHFEGLPVTLLEAGAAGTVPVAHHLDSGIPDVVESGASGFLVAIGDIEGFANAITQLDADRAALERMSGAVRGRVMARYDVRECVVGYQDLCSRLLGRRPRRRPGGRISGSRLDQPWLPNSLVCALRRLVASRGDANANA